MIVPRHTTEVLTHEFPGICFGSSMFVDSLKIDYEKRGVIKMIRSGWKGVMMQRRKTPSFRAGD
jgi:hypothetical protein